MKAKEIESVLSLSPQIILNVEGRLGRKKYKSYEHRPEKGILSFHQWSGKITILKS